MMIHVYGREGGIPAGIMDRWGALLAAPVASKANGSATVNGGNLCDWRP